MQTTLFNFSKAENTAARTEGRLSHRQRLAAVLGDGREWHYTGEMTALQFPTGTCTCGHMGLKYLFRLRHTSGKTAIVGSSCIDIYSEANPDMVESIRLALADELAKAADQRRKAKELAESAEIAALLTTASELAYKLDEALAAGADTYEYRDWQGTWHTGYKSRRRVDYCVFRQWHTADVAATRLADRANRDGYPFRWRQYKAKHAFRKAIQTQIDVLNNLLAGPLWA